MTSRHKRDLEPTETFGGEPRPRHYIRLRLVLWGFLAVYAAVALRLTQLQLIPDERFSREEQKHVGEVEIRVPRGSVYDANGVLLATDKMVLSLWADPRQVQDPTSIARRLTHLLPVDEQDMLYRLTQQDGNGRPMRFVWLKRWLNDEEVARLGDVAATFGPGLYLRPEPLRYYPQGSVASHVLGFTSLEGIGSEGVELQFDKYLNSTPGRRKSRKDAKRNLLSSLTLEYEEPKGGDDLYLTIDATLQQSLENELDKGLEFGKAKRAMGMVMDPKTGAILALACRPPFDPNRYWEYTAEERKNRALVDVFEPGSAFKIVTAAAGLEHAIITPETRIDCMRGSYNPYGHRIRDYHPLGVEPFRVCFAESSNIAMIKVAAMLGPERMEEWIRRFGFGERTSRDFTGESAGLFSQRRRWSRYTMGSLPMGQEISVTMPQLTRAFCAIANGGYLVEPYLVEYAIARDGTVSYEHDARPPRRILSQETANTMKDLCLLVTSDGTGSRASIDEYRVGGKTGTAQIAEPGRGYVPGKFTAIFAGFAPVNDPRLCAVIVVQEPEIRLHFGGWICGPIFKEVIREALIRMNVPQDPVIKDGKSVVKTPETVVADADSVVFQDLEPLSDEELASLDNLELVSPRGDSVAAGPRLPDLTGLTKAGVMARLGNLGLKWDVQGAGRVVAQEPPPGTPISEIDLCRLVFSNERNPQSHSAHEAQ